MGGQQGREGMRSFRKILIVDDDPALRHSLAEQLEQHGEFSAIECGTAVEALATAGRERFDAILLDIGLPDMDGRELCRRMRSARVSVLLARLRAHLRQSEHSDDAVLTIGPYTFQPGAKLMIDGGARKKVRLTEKETAILKYLYRAGDRVIGRDTLLGEVWGYNAGVTTHTLETHVYRLRQKIERDPAHAEILLTEPGGYRLMP